MDQDNLQFIWQEILSDIATPAGWWQLAIVVVACSVAWAINGALRAYVMRNAPEHWKVGIGGINRVLFPLSTLIFVLFGELAIRSWHHTSLLVLASKLLIAMAAIRLIVYAVRYTSQPSGMLKALESTISGFIWLILALHLSGILPGILNTLETIEFTIGKSKINLLVGLQGLLTVLVTIFIAMWFSRVLENKLMRIDDVNMNLRVVLSKLLLILLIFIALLIALSAVGLDITMLSVFGGALAVGLGFGLQRIASNYVSGFIILLDKSMQIGDVLTIDMHYGVVSDLRTRYLVLRKLDGTQVIIPNEMLIINPVINHSFTDHKARVQMPIQVSYDSDLELAMKLMFDIAQDHPRVLVEPPQTVHVKGFGESGIDLMLTVWIPDPEEGSAALQSEINLKIWQAFKANNISIPFPQREVRILNAQESTVDAGLKKET
ncbi:MAG TPA: mechanosensitive ion channel [Methylotenera sp.]|nr:mechanosensitive ion channel [Methylotenera sp.]